MVYMTAQHGAELLVIFDLSTLQDFYNDKHVSMYKYEHKETRRIYTKMLTVIIFWC